MKNRTKLIVVLAMLCLSAAAAIAACQYCTKVDTLVTYIGNGTSCDAVCPAAPACGPSSWRTCDFPEPVTFVNITCTLYYPCAGTITQQFGNCKSHWGCGG